jgi:hypothetical protein
LYFNDKWQRLLSTHAESAVFILLNCVYMGGILSLNWVCRTLSFYQQNILSKHRNKKKTVKTKCWTIFDAVENLVPKISKNILTAIYMTNIGLKVSQYTVFLQGNLWWTKGKFLQTFLFTTEGTYRQVQNLCKYTPWSSSDPFLTPIILVPYTGSSLDRTCPCRVIMALLGNGASSVPI